MTAKTVRRFRIIDSILHRSARRQRQPRSIDRYIDYFGDGRPQAQVGSRAK